MHVYASIYPNVIHQRSVLSAATEWKCPLAVVAAAIIAATIKATGTRRQGDKRQQQQQRRIGDDFDKLLCIVMLDVIVSWRDAKRRAAQRSPEPISINQRDKTFTTAFALARNDITRRRPSSAKSRVSDWMATKLHLPHFDLDYFVCSGATNYYAAPTPHIVQTLTYGKKKHNMILQLRLRLTNTPA